MKTFTVFPRKKEKFFETLEAVLKNTEIGVEGEEIVFTVYDKRDLVILDEIQKDYGFVRSRDTWYDSEDVEIHYFVKQKDSSNTTLREVI